MTTQEKINTIDRAFWKIQALYNELDKELNLRECNSEQYAFDDADEVFHCFDNALDLIHEWKKQLSYELQEAI